MVRVSGNGDVGIVECHSPALAIRPQSLMAYGPGRVRGKG
jgi:hypothetical protein